MAAAVYVYRNTFPHPVDLNEYRDKSGRIWPDTRVEPGGEVTWPIPIGGLELVTATPEPTKDEAAEKATAKASKKPAPAVAPTASQPEPAAAGSEPTAEKEATK